jgi:sterol desaturase/sphingolipid hydroxylase (fatty acid hydroxylase superfamily)
VQHADLRLPAWVDPVLRLVVASPVLHQTHHSSALADTDSNYASVFNFTDRLFGTYRVADPATLHFGDGRE